MRHEEATAAIDKVREWFGGELSKGEYVDAKMASLISAILEAEQLSNWLHDNGSVRGSDSQKESVELLWKVVQACNLEAIREAIVKAEKYANSVRAEKERQFE